MGHALNIQKFSNMCMPRADRINLPGHRFMQTAAKEDPPVFICHFYNFYFAHTAGGRMIGSKMASMILDNATLQFYQYEGDYKPYLENVRDSINTVADSWTREQKDHCLEETKNSFSDEPLLPFWSIFSYAVQLFASRGELACMEGHQSTRLAAKLSNRAPHQLPTELLISSQSNDCSSNVLNLPPHFTP